MEKHDPPPPYYSEQIYPNKYVYYEPKYNKPKTHIVYKPNYHGPVINNQPVHKTTKTTKITQTRYNRATNTKTTHHSPQHNIST